MSDFNDFKTVTARKQHRCEFCGDTIEKDEKYIVNNGMFDGDFFIDRLHQHCQKEVLDRAIVAETKVIELEKALKIMANKVFDLEKQHISSPWYEYEREGAVRTFVQEAMEKARG